MQQTIRDEWIGWEAAAGIDRVLRQPAAKALKFINEQLQAMIGNVYLKDLRRDGILTRSEITKPSAAVIDRLRVESEEALRQHRRNPEKEVHKNGIEAGAASNWEQKARTKLFRSKRCRLLATLLAIRRVFDENLTSELSQKELETRLHLGSVKNAIGQLVRLIKAERVGSI